MSLKKKTDHWIIFQQNQLLLNSAQEIILADDEAFEHLKDNFVRQFYIGRFDQTAFYCAEIQHKMTLPHGITSNPLKRTLNARQEWLTIVSKAIAIVNWDRHHQFCGQCGNSTRHVNGIFERYCQQCELSYFPRISPSVIVLIKRGNEVLLTRGRNYLPGAYGLVAGFVEAGENLEQTLFREVREEVNLDITNIKYFGSQTWPFPDSLMVAFTADYLNGEIIIDTNELESANWYDCNNLPGLPSALSIARTLIEHAIKDMASN